jgi:ADP-heptose:LPS heptosyltransferase
LVKQGKLTLGHLLFKSVLGVKSLLRDSRGPPPGHGEAREILIVASTFLGDLMMSLPLVAAVCRRYPQANVTLLVRQEYVELAEKVKGVRRAIPEPMVYAELRKITAPAPNRFDIAFVVFETRLLPLMAALDVREIVSFDDPKGRHSRLIDRMIAFPTDRPEMMHQAWLALRLLGSDPQFPVLRPPYLDLSTIPEPKKVSRPYVVMHIGARSPLRQWLPERYAQVVVALHERGVETMLTGMDDDALLATRLTERLPPHVTLTNLVGQTSLLELAKRIERARAVFGADTGVLHLAKALGLPVVVLMGQGQNELYGDARQLFGPGQYFYVPALPCRDKHSLHGHQVSWVSTCSRRQCVLEKQLCIYDVQAEPVIAALLKFALSEADPQIQTVR